MSEKYNGWANRETWLINLWVGDYLQELADEGQELDADTLEELVTELLDPPTEGALADLCGLWRVDWHELAEHLEVEEAA